MGGLSGKVVLVTGAGKGRGRHLALSCAAAGALLAVNDISPVNLDVTQAGILAAGGRVISFVEDIAKKMPVQSLLNQVLDAYGRLDVLVNCAEVQPSHSLLQMDEWDWQRTLDVNLTGAFLLTQSAARIMKEKGEGVIIHMDKPGVASELHAAYLASKSGLQKMVECARTELAPFGIRVYLACSAEQALEVCQC